MRGVELELVDRIDLRHQTFMLSGNPLAKGEEVTYLGVSLSQSGVTDTKMFERLRKANKCGAPAQSIRGLNTRDQHTEINQTV